jgi:ABC-type branched-subunit amino acid transport system ATPase component
VLAGVDLAVGTGEVVAILGRNGAGKTTLLRAVMGLARARAGLAYLPQGRQIFPRLSVRDNLRAAAVAVGGDADARIEQIVAEFPILAPKLGARGASLSGGQQQILALARALIARPRLLLLDEPTEGIQPSIVDAIQDKIAEINRRQALAVLLVEQNLEFATALATRSYIIEKGRIARDLLSADLLGDVALQHEYLGV